jgi:predicted metal-dependent hydrolase
MAAEIREPSLDPEEQRAFLRGVEQFNAGDFFGCHDTLEELWSGVRGPSRSFFQGLIQVSVAFYHLGNGNLGGTASMLRRALQRFEGYPGLKRSQSRDLPQRRWVRPASSCASWGRRAQPAL